MSRHLRDLLALLDKTISVDSYGVPGSDFYVCHICQCESGAGLLMRPDWHAKDCPVPRMSWKYGHKGQRPRNEK